MPIVSIHRCLRLVLMTAILTGLNADMSVVEFKNGDVYAVGSSLESYVKITCSSCPRFFNWYIRMIDGPPEALHVQYQYNEKQYRYEISSNPCKEPNGSRSFWCEEEVEKLQDVDVKEFLMKLTLRNLSIALNGSTVAATTIDFGEENKSFSVMYCPKLSDPQHGLAVSYTMGGEYSSVANYSCTNGSLYVNNKYQPVLNRTCSASAEWEPKNREGYCWYDPSSITVQQMTFKEDQLLSLACVDTEDGNPSPTGYNFSFSNELITSASRNYQGSHSIGWEDNGKSISCRLISSFSLANADAGRSAPEKFIVFFGIKNQGNEGSHHIPTNSTGNFSVIIYANPENGTVQAGMFTLSGGNVTDELEQKLQLIDDTKYIYTYTLDRSTILERQFIFKAVTTAPYSNVSIPVNITDEAPTTNGPLNPTGGPSSSLPTYVVPVVICAAVLCLILTVVLIFLVRRRQKKSAHGGVTRDRQGHEPSASDDMNREERANPLYGISPNQEREERVNPLYGSSAGAMIADDTYSEVKKDKKGKRKGNDNKGYSNENVGDMYAEVKKPKKHAPKPNVTEATYAAVDKKKKKGAAQISLHGSPVA